MAKGQQRSNREVKKPKMKKIKVIAAAPAKRVRDGSRPSLKIKEIEMASVI